MDIVKRLSLNKTPKSVENNSIVAAKNIMVDNTGSFITNEPGFSVAFECPNKDNGEHIVGCIPCAKEIVIFTYQEVIGGENKSRIYRYYDDGVVVNVSTSWKYNGGKIIGAYTYSYKQELIIAVSEYDAFDEFNNRKLIPLKSWNLDTETELVENYNTEANISPFTSKYDIGTSGSLLSGVYTFFIRFKISESAYTKWFQITDDIIIINYVGKEKTNHTYLQSNGTDIATTQLTIPENEVFELNNNNISSNNIVLKFTFSENIQFEEYQIAYVFKRNTDQVARIKSNYSVNVTAVDITNNEYVEEVSIDELLEQPHQFYNVKSLINYNNRLYIGNYEEYKYENLQDYADTINTNFVYSEEGLNYSENIHISTQQVDTSVNGDVGFEGLHSLINVETETRNGEVYIKNPVDFIRRAIASKMKTYAYVDVQRCPVTFFGKTQFVTKGLSESKTYPIRPGVVMTYKATLHQALYIVFNHNDSPVQHPIYYSEGYFNPGVVVPDSRYDYDIKVKNETDLYLCYTKDNINYEVLLNSKDFSNPIYDEEKPNDVAMLNVSHFTKITNNLDPYADPINVFYWISSGNYQPSAYYVPYAGIRCSTKYISNDTDIVLKSNNIYNNDRTLIPNQVYSFYVHYLREDYSYTDGFPISAKPNGIGYTVITNSFNLKLFKINEIVNTSGQNKTLIFPEFTNITIPPGYIGCFITYEAIEKTAIPLIVINKTNTTSPDLTKYAATNTNYIFNDDAVFGTDIRNITKHANISGTNITVVKKEIRNNLQQPYVEIVAQNLNDTTTGVKDIFEFILNSTAIYTKSNKVLYRLTNNILKFNNESTLSYTFNTITPADGAPVYSYLPSFYNKEKLIVYTDTSNNLKGFIMSPTSSNVLDDNGTKQDGYIIKLIQVNSYNDIPINAYSILQDYAQGAVSLTDNQAKPLGVYYNKILSPDKLQSFLEIKQAYSAKPLQVFTNYSKNHTNIFSKTIYRSDVISDESLVNGFRNFEVTNYKNIIENKGEIVNIIGIGLYLIIHTEYSMFVFDRSPKLTQKSQLDIPDAFEIDYQEVMPSNEGFGGLADREESILTKHGYIWFDKVNKYIFIYENGNAKIISQDINNFIKNLDINTVRFAEDITNNRLLICFYITTYTETEQHTVVSSEEQITISYSFITNTFISLHDYTFTHNFRTYKNSYIFDKNKDNTRLYIFDKNSKTYSNLINTNSVYYPTYIDNVNYTLEYNFNLLDWDDNSSESSDVVYDSNESDNSTTEIAINETRAKNYIDIIFNLDYNVPKVLNSIRYILSEINSEYDAINVSEEYLNRRFSGNAIEIYSDECYTGVLDVTQKEIINRLEEIKVPYWQNGCWNLNYFRNRITEDVNLTELQELTHIPYYNKVTGETENVTIDIDRLKKALHYNTVTNTADKSDNRSLVYGKYFVVRFIFDNDKRFKLDELSFNIERY